ncbi:hypothetical protein [Pseudonocardia sp. NPDC046786]|uniref:hypothetical protein n=1 Tax=Pseudonocardia sp. NPDC046786 TaxID=3155471 RepID=UPI0033FB1F59
MPDIEETSGTLVAAGSGRSIRELGGTIVDSGLAGVSRAGGAVQAKADKWRAAEPDDRPEDRP